MVKTDYYCHEKFTWLTVDLEKRQAYSCCAVPPEKIDTVWLEKNPGQLFNNPNLQQERQDMLANRAVKSCENICWKPESQGLVSRRMTLPITQDKFNSVVMDRPKKLHLVLGSNCNMTCVYCCKQYSTAWLRDVDKNGAYFPHDRWQINNLDKVLLKISQNEHRHSKTYSSLLDEIKKTRPTDQINISGGEPFLYNGLTQICNNLSKDVQIDLYTGLGVDKTRFAKQLDQLINKDKITLVISAENLDRLYEFNRYGNTWDNFLANLTSIKNQGFNWKFSCVLSNLTIFGFKSFIDYFADVPIRYEFCNEPEFLSVHVLDDHSKIDLIKTFKQSNIPFADSIIQAISVETTDQQKNNLSKYLIEFARRRNLDMQIFPKSFVSWLNQNSNSKIKNA